MKTFKEFILERKVDPVSLAQRVARRYGKRISYGRWLKASKGEHIPVKAYKSKEADSVFNKADRVQRKASPEYGKKGYADVTDPLFTKKKFKISDLSPTQPFVSTGNIETLKHKVHGSSEGVRVATHKGKHYILDGHHRVMGAAMRGDKEIEVNHINLDQYK